MDSVCLWYGSIGEFYRAGMLVLPWVRVHSLIWRTMELSKTATAAFPMRAEVVDIVQRHDGYRAQYCHVIHDSVMAHPRQHSVTFNFTSGWNSGRRWLGLSSFHCVLRRPARPDACADCGGPAALPYESGVPGDPPGFTVKADVAYDFSVGGEVVSSTPENLVPSSLRHSGGAVCSHGTAQAFTIAEPST